jgi:hypothetical protein
LKKTSVLSLSLSLSLIFPQLEWNLVYVMEDTELLPKNEECCVHVVFFKGFIFKRWKFIFSTTWKVIQIFGSIILFNFGKFLHEKFMVSQYK